MPSAWEMLPPVYGTLGTIHVFASSPGHKRQDVTYFRGVPTVVESWSSADPFGDAVATITFSQITPFDDVGNGDLSWLQDFADFEITIPEVNATVFEGFLASMEWTADGSSTSLQIQLQGALFQVDKYVSYPEFPPRPILYENMIAECFDPRRRPNLRCKPLKIEWPAGWSKVAQTPANTPGYLIPVATPGQKITGFSGRSTGAWDKSLTSFVQGLLQVMYTDDFGDQWTIRKDAERQPVLYVRTSRVTTPTHTFWAGEPGVSVTLTRDLTQFANLIYGQGTDVNGVEYDRQVVSTDGSRTDYNPMAYDPQVYPTQNNLRYNHGRMRVETYVKFDNGFDEAQALATSKQLLMRNEDPGVAGTITLSADPGVSRYLIKAGDTLALQGFAGTGAGGLLFHISQVTVNASDGTVELTVDTKFRDALTLEEVLVRTRDPLTPIKLLQVNRRSQVVEDQLAPWNYNKGSGFVPKSSVPFYRDIPKGELFPYTNWAKRYPPKKYPHFYVKVRANAHNRKDRWTCGAELPILLSEKGTIRLTQVCCYDESGNRLAIPFHFSIYYNPVSADHMPRDDLGPSPFIPSAFESTNQFGQIIPAGTEGASLLPDPSLIIGWGNHDQPAGFSPGSRSGGDPVSGLLIDETPWTFDFTTVKNGFNPDPVGGREQSSSVITAYGALFADHHSYVYFSGRLFRQEPGVA